MDISQKNLPTNRRDAIALGVSRYFTGKPCKHGHISIRYTHSGCLTCFLVKKRRVNATPEGRRRKYEMDRRYYQSDLGKAFRRNRRLRDKAAGKDKQSTWHQRTPKWADIKAITEFLSARPPGYHLDHILPIRGKTVSGLHVLENLQYLPADKNRAKSNSVIPITLEAAVCPL